MNYESKMVIIFSIFFTVFVSGMFTFIVTTSNNNLDKLKNLSLEINQSKSCFELNLETQNALSFADKFSDKERPYHFKSDSLNRATELNCK